MDGAVGREVPTCMHVAEGMTRSHSGLSQRHREQLMWGQPKFAGYLFID